MHWPPAARRWKLWGGVFFLSFSLEIWKMTGCAWDESMTLLRTGSLRTTYNLCCRLCTTKLKGARAGPLQFRQPWLLFHSEKRPVKRQAMIPPLDLSKRIVYAYLALNDCAAGPRLEDGERLGSQAAASKTQQSREPSKTGNLPAGISHQNLSSPQTPRTSRKPLSARTRSFRPVVVADKVDADGDILDIAEQQQVRLA